jgi:mannose-6-phosphate isomerase-like protein (cupin superfamily)
MTSDDAPANTATGGSRKRAIITYATAASIPYLVKNFTSPRTACPVIARETSGGRSTGSTALTSASIPPLIPRYEIHASAPPATTPAAAPTRSTLTAAAITAITPHAMTAFCSSRRSSGSGSPNSNALSCAPMLIALLLVASLQARPIESADGITRTVIVDRKGFQADRVTFAPRASAAPAGQGYDAVLVPIDGGMTAQVDGQPVAWRPGVAILIPRGAPHRFANPTSSPVSFISVRRLGDADIAAPPPPATNGATVVRNADSKYVRATTVRVERGGEIRSPAAQRAGPTVFVLAGSGDIRMTIGSAVSDFPQQHAGTVWMFDSGTPFALANIGASPFEVVRISAPATMSR